MGVTTLFAILIPWCLFYFFTIGAMVYVSPDECLSIRLRGWVLLFFALPVAWIAGIYKAIRLGR